MSTTLYLKYRPQSIEELDLVEVRESLGKILKSGKMPHAFLFCGPRGTGKTSSARILAKTINGDETVLDTPDVVEMDAASNRGVDDIRALRESVALAPMRAKYKVYIIDEVHMLTTEAFNALLKTLEEPPKHVIFVLCTTEVEKLPETVVSRCTKIQFKKPGIDEIVNKLKFVARNEKLEIRNEEMEKIAKAARGSFRDAIKILEQVMLTGKSMEEEMGVERFVKLLRDQEVKGALEFVNGLVERGVSIRGFIERCIEELREELLGTLDKSILPLIEGLERAYERTKTTAVEQLPLEVFVIEMTSGGGSKESTPPPSVSPPKLGGDSGGVKELERRNIGSGKYKLDDLVARWPEVLREVKPKNHSVEALLRSTRPMDFDGSNLKLEVFYKFHKDKLESDRCRQIVENGVGTVFGIDPVRLVLKLGEKPRSVEEDIVKAAEEIFKVAAI